MALKRVKKEGVVTPMYTEADAQLMGEQYLEISEQIKTLEARKKELAERIKDCATKYGVKDDKGSYYCETDTCVYGRVARKSVKIDQEKAQEVLKKIGREDLIDRVVSYVVNEDRLEEAIQKGDISIKTVEGFTDITTSYSVSVKKAEVAEEVVQSTFKKASRKKK